MNRDKPYEDVAMHLVMMQLLPYVPLHLRRYVDIHSYDNLDSKVAILLCFANGYADKVSDEEFYQTFVIDNHLRPPKEGPGFFDDMGDGNGQVDGNPPTEQ